jgi:hypothetical protein
VILAQSTQHIHQQLEQESQHIMQLANQPFGTIANQSIQQSSSFRRFVRCISWPIGASDGWRQGAPTSLFFDVSAKPGLQFAV